MRTALFALGNVLYGDDAAGPMILHWVQAHAVLPPELCVEDLGTPGFDLARWFSEYERLLIVDAVRFKAEPGTLVKLTEGQLNQAQPAPRLSPHEPVLTDALALAHLSGLNPREVAFIGLVPHTMAMGRVRLSDEVRGGVPAAGRAVVEQLVQWGFEVPWRSEPLPPPWWEAPAEMVQPHAVSRQHL
jgi:hydrogenase maturation protease